MYIIRRELQATAATARRRTPDTRDEFTLQEAQIARLARDGMANPEIAAHLFLRPRAVESAPPQRVALEAVRDHLLPLLDTDAADRVGTAIGTLMSLKKHLLICVT